MTSNTSTTSDTPAKTRTAHACACMTGTEHTCKSTTQRAFAQGHDARMAGRVAQLVADGKMTADDGEKLIRQAGGGDLLVSKMRHSARLRSERGKGDKAPKAPKATKEQAAAVATPSVMGTKVKVHHGQRQFDAVVVRNAAETLVARHRMNSQNCDHEVSVEDGEVFTGKAIK